MELAAGSLAADRVRVAPGVTATIGDGFAMAGSGTFTNEGRVLLPKVFAFSHRVSLIGAGVFESGSSAVWSFGSDFVCSSTNAQRDFSSATLCFTSGGPHLLQMNSPDRSNTMAGLNDKTALGALQVAGELRAQGVTYVWSLSGSGTLIVTNSGRFYYGDAVNWSGTASVAPGSIFQQVSSGVARHGTPLSWLASHGLTNELANEEELLDRDNDGLANWQEYIAGTDPTNSESTLRSMPLGAAAPGKFVISWPSSSNRAYSILKTLGLESPFSLLATNQPARPPLNVYTDQVSGAAAYYRIQVDSGP